VITRNISDELADVYDAEKQLLKAFAQNGQSCFGRGTEGGPGVDLEETKARGTMDRFFDIFEEPAKEEVQAMQDWLRKAKT